MKRLAIALVALAALALPFTRRTLAGDGPQNPGFELGTVGEAPKGWLVPGPSSSSGYTVKLTDQRPKRGKLCAVIELSGPRRGNGFGNLMQSVDAAPYRGKQVRFKAAVRTEGVESRAQMWMRVDRPGGVMGFFDNMGDRPIVSATWSDYEIVGDVEDDAASLSFGVMFTGGTGSVWIDDVSLEILGATREVAPEAAQPLMGRALENLGAFARLYGYVRFFHPSDQAAALDANAWCLFAIPGVGSVEAAANPRELAASLTATFQSVAPTLQVWAGGPDGGPPALARLDGTKRAVCWQHHGCGGLGPPDGLYKSARVPVASASPDIKLPAQGTCIVKDLGGGVSCRLPVAVDVDADGKTLPRAAVGAVSAAPARTPRAKPSGKDRATRLADVVIAWNVFQHFFPYFDVSKPDWPAVLRRSLAEAATDVDDAAFVLTLRRLVAELGDGHGSVFPSGVLRPMPPAWALDWADDGKGGDALVVVAVGTQVGGVKVGDEIVAVVGTPIAQWVADARPLVSAATEGWARHRIATDPEFLAAGKGRTLEFTVRRGGKEQRVEVPRFAPGMGAPPFRERRPVNGAEVGPSGSGIVYFDLNAAGDEALAAAMPKLQAAKAIVFDARGYPGSAGRSLLQHLSDKPLESARWIIPTFTLPDQDPAGLAWDESGRWNLAPALPRLGAGGQKIAFLTGGGAISYAESCLGIVEAYRLGEIVGGPTAGTNGNVNPFTLPGGFRVLWTGMKVLKHDRSRHHGVGILPTVPVRRTVAGIAAGRDEVLDAAVKKLAE